MTIGKYYDLQVAREVDFGVYLTSDLGDILLPMKYVPEGTEVDSFVHVFLYKDSEDRLIATTLNPVGILGEYAAMKVKDLAPHGAYMDWGLEKDLLVPNREQPQPYSIGETHVIKVCYDYKTENLIGVGKISGFINQDHSELEERMEVNLLIYKETDLGFEALINQKYSGLIYANEVFESLQIGHQRTGFIHKLRDDGKIDLRINKVGAQAVDENAQAILDYLNAHDGFVGLADNSSPEMIKEKLNMSKKSFKKAIGSLYKQRLIQIEPVGIRLKS